MARPEEMARSMTSWAAPAMNWPKPTLRMKTAIQTRFGQRPRSAPATAPQKASGQR